MNETNPTEEKTIHLFSQLSEKDKDLVIDFIKLFIEKSNKSG